MARYLIDDRVERRRLGLEAPGLPAAEFVPPGTDGLGLPIPPEGTETLGLGAGLPLPADPGPRVPLGVSPGGYGLNLPEPPEEPLSTIGARVERAQAAQRPGALERFAAGVGRVDRAYLEARDPMAQKFKSLQVLTAAIDKLGDQPEALAAFGPILREFGRTLDLDLTDEDLKAWAGVKGAAPSLATLAQIAPPLAEEFQVAFERTKDARARQDLVKTYQQRSLDLAMPKAAAQLRRFLADPEERGRLVGPDGKIPEAALLAELDRPEHQLSDFEKRTMAAYIQSDVGRGELVQLGVQPGSVALAGAEAQAKARETPTDYGDARESVAQATYNKPFAALSQPEKQAVLKIVRQEKREDTAASLALASELREEVAVERETRKKLTDASVDVQQLDELMSFVDRLDDLTDKVNLFDGPGSRIPQAAMAKYQQLMQTDPNFLALAAAGRRLTQFARQVGLERGNIAERDVQRWERALPDATFTRTGAKAGLKEIRADLVDKAHALQRRLVREGVPLPAGFFPDRLTQTDRAGATVDVATREALRTLARQLKADGKTVDDVKSSRRFQALPPDQQRLLLEEF